MQVDKIKIKEELIDLVMIEVIIMVDKEVGEEEEEEDIKKKENWN